MTGQILQGYTVLDLSQVVAGPTVTRLMAEMGARVIKVEIAPGGDLSHQLPYIRNGRSAYYVQQNRGKQSLCLDVKSPQGQRILADLAARCDVLVEAFSPGAIGRLGLAYEQVRKRNTDIVMCSISAFGQTGPMSNLPGYDYIAQAYSGVTGLIGEPDGSPYFPQLALGDSATGGYALAAILAALLHRERGGGGQYLDISLMDVYLSSHEIGIQASTASNGQIRTQRTGRQHFSVAPLGIFRGAQGYLVIIALGQRQWSGLCEAMQRPEWSDDPRFADNASRMTHLDDIVAGIETWLADLGDDDEAMRRLQARHVPHAPVLTVEQVLALPQVQQRRSVIEVEDPYVGRFKAPASPLRFSATPGQSEMPAPWLGEHNAQVLGELLGTSAGEIAALQAQGVLHQHRPEAR